MGHTSLGTVRIGLAPAEVLDDCNTVRVQSAVVAVAERNGEVRPSRVLNKVRSGVVADPPPREMEAHPPLAVVVAVAADEVEVRSSKTAEIVKTRQSLAEADGDDSGTRRNGDAEAVVVLGECSRVDVVAASRKSDGVVFAPSRTIDAAMTLVLAPRPSMVGRDFAVGTKDTPTMKTTRMVRVVRRERTSNHDARMVTPDVWKKDLRNPNSQTLLRSKPFFLPILLLLADRKAEPSVCSHWPCSSCPLCPSGAVVVVGASHRSLLLLIPLQMTDLAFEAS